MTSSGQDEFKFGRSTPRSAGRSTPQYRHLVVQNGIFTLLLTSSGQARQLADLPADLPLPPALTSSGQEWQFLIATAI